MTFQLFDRFLIPNDENYKSLKRGYRPAKSFVFWRNIQWKISKRNPCSRSKLRMLYQNQAPLPWTLKFLICDMIIFCKLHEINCETEMYLAVLALTVLDYSLVKK